MNSYPPELMAQLAPIMFVAGLDDPNTHQDISLTEDSPAPSPNPQDPFASLISRLRSALAAQRRLGIWQPASQSKAFHIVMVDRQLRFPPRKLPPPADSPHSTAHSPLSPLTPSSPLFPDGLIAPIWIRKHTTLVPSVFVLFMRLFEYTSGTRTPLDGPDLDREREEKQRDSELSAEISLRKRSTSERSIKLTVVLLASRTMLDDPALDSRLTFIRRQSGLDSRAALFVLSPVSQAELAEFTKSLQQALYEPALEYYLSQSKRVRRKRNRHSQAVTGIYTNPVASPVGTPVPRPLRPEGWTVRYEYKMACFAEFRGEDEVALKHYQDSYSTLVLMFGSTAVMPPRTKRWAEAKVLADCINIKICKLYLYNNEHSMALSQHNGHIKKFSDLSRGWGIGEETFEFWSWVARQHRVLAELLEQGLRSTLTIPSHTPPPQASLAQLQAQALVTGARTLDINVSRGLNPSTALQHPGFYYYMAARCTECRRARFLKALEYEDRLAHTTPGFANEKKVDHLTIILELYTKSYELFKAHSTTAQGQGRLTLSIAYRIAQTYHEAGKHDMAVRFFERIAKTYRREKWGVIIRPMLSTWYACAQQLGDVELSVKLLIEMLVHGRDGSEEDMELQDDLLAVLQSTVPSSDAPLTVDLSEAPPLLNANVLFWFPQTEVGQPAPFQIALKTPTGVNISSLPIQTLTVHFSGDVLEPIVLTHSESDVRHASVQFIEVGNVGPQQGGKEVSSEANLRWAPETPMILSGTLSLDRSISCSVSHLVIRLKLNSWDISIPFGPSREIQSSWLISPDPPRYVPFRRPDPHIMKFVHRPHRVALTFKHQGPAYVGEEFPIEISAENADERDFDVVVDVLLQPSEVEDAVNSMTLGDKQSSSLIKGVDFGTIASGQTVSRTLLLTSTGAEGDRTLDISAQSRPNTRQGEDEEKYATDTTDTLETLVIPVLFPFKNSSDVVYQSSLKPNTSLADLAAFEPDFWDEGDECVINTRLELAGPWSVKVESLQLVGGSEEGARIISNSTASTPDIFPQEIEPGDILGDICHIQLAKDLIDPSLPLFVPSPGEYEVKWRRVLPDGTHGGQTTTRIALPPLRQPAQNVVALLEIPPVAKLHTLITARMRIRNEHAGQSANVFVQIDPDPSDGFIISGLRSGRLPILMPGGEEVVTWGLVALECGNVKLPKMRIVDRRRPGPASISPDMSSAVEEKLIPIVDTRSESRKMTPEGFEVDTYPQRDSISILVLP